MEKYQLLSLSPVNQLIINSQAYKCDSLISRGSFGEVFLYKKVYHLSNFQAIGESICA